MTFESEKWVAILDLEACPYSRQQVDALKANDVHTNLILCNKPEHSESKPCKSVSSFPTFCYIETGECFAGLKRTVADLDDLQSKVRV